MKPKIYIETSVVSYYTNRPSRDIVTAIIKKRIIKIVEKQGYECPVICSPEELEEE